MAASGCTEQPAFLLAQQRMAQAARRSRLNTAGWSRECTTTRGRPAALLTHEHHEQAGVHHSCVEALAGGDKGGEGPDDEGDEEAPEDGFADPCVLQAQLLQG